MNKQDSTLIGLTTLQLQKYLKELDEKEFRGKQIAKWLYKQNVRDFSLMTDLSKDLREKLQQNIYVSNNKIINKSISSSGTTKYLIELFDKEKIECVKITHKKHQTVCISSQVGCPVACNFCATGLNGYKRNLKCSEIVDQFLLIRSEEKSCNDTPLNHIVFMGMGEPLLNLNEVIKAINILNKEIGIGIRRITISTIGIINGIQELMDKGFSLNIAVSLHAPNQNIREKLIPFCKSYPYFELLKMCKKYAEITKRRITFEYTPLQGINDSLEYANELLKNLKGIHCHINLIPFNLLENCSYKPSSLKQIIAFQMILNKAGFPATIRKSSGQDIKAACGQLTTKLKIEN